MVRSLTCQPRSEALERWKKNKQFFTWEVWKHNIPGWCLCADRNRRMVLARSGAEKRCGECGQRCWGRPRWINYTVVLGVQLLGEDWEQIVPINYYWVMPKKSVPSLDLQNPASDWVGLCLSGVLSAACHPLLRHPHPLKPPTPAIHT